MTINRRCLTEGAKVTRITGTGIVQMTTQTCLSWRTFADVGSDAVVARSSVVARPHDAVVDVDGAVGPSPSVHTDAQVSAHLVGTGATVLAQSLINAFIRVFSAEHTCPLSWTPAAVASNSIDTGSIVGAGVSKTVIRVHFTATSHEACRTLALVGQWPGHQT